MYNVGLGVGNAIIVMAEGFFWLYRSGLREKASANDGMCTLTRYILAGNRQNFTFENYI